MKTSQKGSLTFWLLIILIILIALAYYMNAYKAGKTSSVQSGTSTPFYTPLDPTWIGIYSFEESSPPDNHYTYTVAISGDTYNPTILIDIDGAQTEQRLTAYGIENGNRLNVIFSSYRPGNQFTPYSQGQWLFSLEQTATPNKYKIIWNALKPVLVTTDPTTTFFTKQ